MPPGERWLKRQDVAHLQVCQPFAKSSIFSIETIGHRCLKCDIALLRLRDQFQRNFQFGTNRWIAFTTLKPSGWCIWLNLQWKYTRSSAHRLVTETTPLSILPRFARYCRPTCAVL